MTFAICRSRVRWASLTIYNILLPIITLAESTQPVHRGSKTRIWPHFVNVRNYRIKTHSIKNGENWILTHCDRMRQNSRFLTTVQCTVYPTITWLIRYSRFQLKRFKFSRLCLAFNSAQILSWKSDLSCDQRPHCGREYHFLRFSSTLINLNWGPKSNYYNEENWYWIIFV